VVRRKFLELDHELGGEPDEVKILMAVYLRTKEYYWLKR